MMMVMVMMMMTKRCVRGGRCSAKTSLPKQIEPGSIVFLMTVMMMRSMVTSESGLLVGMRGIVSFVRATYW